LGRVKEQIGGGAVAPAYLPRGYVHFVTSRARHTADHLVAESFHRQRIALVLTLGL